VSEPEATGNIVVAEEGSGVDQLIENNETEDILPVPPRWKKNDHSSLTTMFSWTTKDISNYQYLNNFFETFEYDPYNPEQSIPWNDLADFLKEIRAGGRNMFVAPISQNVYVHEDRYQNKNLCIVVQVNVVWESFGKCERKLCVYGAFGDIGFVEFEIDGTYIVNWKFRHLQDPPPYRTLDEMPQIPRDSNGDDHRVCDLPTLFLDCSYSGPYAYFYKGHFDYPWLSHWNLTAITEGTQNGVESFSSVDTTGCWVVSLWDSSGWMGKNIMITDNKEACFAQGMGWMNDRAQSISVFSLCDNIEP